ncbi:MAG: GNAT family N-acetyltransferase [Candidatus Krumholzibacteriia bacterium]
MLHREGKMIRAAKQEDLDALVAGNIAMARETESLDLDAETVRSGVRAVLERSAPGSYRVVEEEGRVVAQLLLTYEWSDWRNRPVWWIQSVYVAPEARRRGLFKRLYGAVVEEARAAGVAGVRLYVERTNAAAQAVYEALGMDGGRYRVYEAMFDEPPHARET